MKSKYIQVEINGNGKSIEVKQGESKDHARNEEKLIGLCNLQAYIVQIIQKNSWDKIV